MGNKSVEETATKNNLGSSRPHKSGLHKSELQCSAEESCPAFWVTMYQFFSHGKKNS